MIDHPTPRELEAFALEALEGADRDRVGGHVSTCPECRDRAALSEDAREALTTLLAPDPLPAGLERMEPRARRRLERVLPPALVAAALLAAFALWEYGGRPWISLPGSRQEGDGPKVDALLKALDDDDPEVRAKAEADLVKMGPAVRERLEAARLKASEEVGARIQAIMVQFMLYRQEQFALERLRKADPFPVTDRREYRLENSEIAARALEKVARLFGLRLDIYGEDPELRAELERHPIRNGLTSSAGDAEVALFHVTSQVDATWVVDGGRVVVVRLTPALLLERLKQEGDRHSLYELDRRLLEFDRPEIRHMTSAGRFFQQLSEERGARRERWLSELAARAANPDLPLETRILALRSVAWFFGARDGEQPDAARVFVKHAMDERAPRGLREEAAGGLVHCLEPEAREALLTILEGGDGGLQKRILLRFNLWGILSGWSRIGKIAAERTRLSAALARLEGAADPDLSVQALSVRVALREAGAAARLVQRPLPEDLPTRQGYLQALNLTLFYGGTEAMERIRAMGRASDPTLRAYAALLHGRMAGGQNRGWDVEAAGRLLGDAEPVVRWAAARAIGSVYTRGSSEPYLEGLDAAKVELRKALEKESHPKVREALEKALNEAR